MADPRGHRERTDAAATGRNEEKQQRDGKDPAESMHHDGSFGRYMQLKVVKLREQFDAQQLQNIATKSDIFRGVSIYVNGFTRPSHAELKQLMALHGGRFENYLNRDSVTHIICSNLPDTKIKQLAHERRGTAPPAPPAAVDKRAAKPIPIVRPEWVVASINAGRLLPISDFQLEPLSAAHPNQRRLFDFKRHAAPKLPPEELYPVLMGQGQGQGQVGQQQQEEGRQQQQEKGLERQGQQQKQQQQQEEEEELEGRRPEEVHEVGEGRPAKRQRVTRSVVRGEPGQGPGAGRAHELRVWQVQHRGEEEEGEGGQQQQQQQCPSAMHQRVRATAQGPQQQQQPLLPHGFVDSVAPGGTRAALLHQAGGLGTGPGPPSSHPRRPYPAAAAAGTGMAGTSSGISVPVPLPLPCPARPRGSGSPPPPHTAVEGASRGGGGGGVAVPPASANEAATRVAGGPGTSTAAANATAAVPGGGGAARGSASPSGGSGSSPGVRRSRGGGSPQSGDQAQALAAELRAASDAARGPPRSTRTDPRFMETFFKSSRLHFIGTWKTRIEALMAEVEGTAPNPAPYTKGTERVVMHVDMDCFFASAALVGRPELAGRPLAVCHSNSARGTGEVSSANYLVSRRGGEAARSFGVRADMFIAEARRRCPDLVVVPYEFEKYQEISEQVYRILMSYTSIVQPMSCDEAFLDVTGLVSEPSGPEELAARLRYDIATATQCTASAGIGPNMLIAKLATKRAKPNGQFRVTRGSVLEFLGDLNVDELPGVGWSIASKLEDQLGITRVRQVWSASRTLLQKRLGARARKSVGAEVNYGIRFECESEGGRGEVERFLGDLAGEVAARLRSAGVRGRCLVLKVKRRQAGAPEPAKFMGHGACDNISRSVTMSRFTAEAGDLRAAAVGLLRALAIPPEELRGLGITVCKLDNDPASATTRASAPAAAKLQAPPRTAFDASKPPPWAVYFKRKAQQQPQQQQQEAEAEPPSAAMAAASTEQGQTPSTALLTSPSDSLTAATATAAPSTPAKFHPTGGARQGGSAAAATAVVSPGALLSAGAVAAAAAAPGPGERGGNGAPAARPGAGAGSGRGHLAAPAGQSPAAAGICAAGAAAVAAGGVEDVPSWYAALYNEWSPVSVWDQQRKQQQLAAPAHQQLHQLQQGVGQRASPAGMPPAEWADGAAFRSTSFAAGAGTTAPAAAPAAVAAAGATAPPSEVGCVAAIGTGGQAVAAQPGPQQQHLPARIDAASEVSAHSAAGGREGAPAADAGARSRPRPRPRLHPVFAALLSQPGAVAGRSCGGDGGQGSKPGGGREVTAAASPPAPSVTAADAGAAAPVDALVQTAATVQVGGGPSSKGSLFGGGGDIAHQDPAGHLARPPQPPEQQQQQQLVGVTTAAAAARGSTAAAAGGHNVLDCPLPQPSRPAASGTHGAMGAAGPPRVPRVPAAPPVPAVSTASAGAGPSAASGGDAVTRVMESIDLSIDLVDDDDSEDDTGGPAGSTSGVSGSAAARWPAGFLKPPVGGGSGGRAAGRGRGRGGRGRGAAGSGGGRATGVAVGRNGAGGCDGGGGGGGSSMPRGHQGLQPAMAAAVGAASAATAFQIDLSVLAELPPDVRREVEREYAGLLAAPATRHTAPGPAPGPARGTRRAHGSNSGGGVAAQPPQGVRHVATGAGQSAGGGDDVAPQSAADRGAVGRDRHVQAMDMDSLQRRSTGAETGVAEGVDGGAARPLVAAAAAPGVMPTSMADVDFAVLNELPVELRSEITAELRRRQVGNGAAVKGPVLPPSAHLPPPPARGPPDVHVTGSGPVNSGNGASVPAVVAVGEAHAAVLRREGGSRVAAPKPAAGGEGGSGMPPPPPPPQFRLGLSEPSGGDGVAKWAGLAATRAGSPDIEEVMAVAALPASADPQQRLAAAAAHMFFGSQGTVSGPATMAAAAAAAATAVRIEGGYSDADVRRAFLAAIRSACARAGVVAVGGNSNGVEEVAVEGRDGAAAADGGRGDSGQIRAAAGVRTRRGPSEGATGEVALAAVAEEDGAGGEGENRRIQVTFMALALWLISQDHDLEGVVAMLRQVLRAHQLLWIETQRVVQAVREHVLHKFGFLMKL
ncbi:hypothetical protein VOLCADRAFT_97374 [Volvox carteri f. nagariensis]|uniref:DNA repair protein REV1 n=1 Tax=Volvox carteri f. nagariensis TaxID=3068 RepID=D8UCK7_VOLCA|nr:uncharacterized protein VOLCADRAFT_97374 [Volvox carteri f. nagariensis]EFJ42568.1 hypothetical protein VOLCADRAFT_97374 [Volvox carteri f. nagariensis]|eukprot:XP_002956424.1 hypothetical protein VOLCADRAFT_97374 [Volvox carteri f. nagariensis]